MCAAVFFAEFSAPTELPSSRSTRALRAEVSGLRTQHTAQHIAQHIQTDFCAHRACVVGKSRSCKCVRSKLISLGSVMEGRGAIVVLRLQVRSTALRVRSQQLIAQASAGALLQEELDDLIVAGARSRVDGADALVSRSAM